MAFVNFDGATGPVRMIDQNLVAFDNANTVSGTLASWETPAGHEVDLLGSGFAFDAQGRPTGGRATSAQIDLGDDGLNDVQISGINVEATVLDDGAEAFWSATLAGTTIIDAQALSKDVVPFGFVSSIFGDDFASATAASDASVTDRGGNDIITLGTGAVFAIGDASTVEGVFDAVSPRFAVYEAGDDQILAQSTDRDHTLVGDAFTVGINARLIGGDDLFSFSADEVSEVIGDVFRASGSNGDRSFIQGGADRIEAKSGNLAAMTGDVLIVSNGVDVVGGDDTIVGADKGEEIAGDVRSDSSTGGATIVGGKDTIDGGGGDDLIAGDVLDDSGSGFVTGGNDTIRGGEGADTIFGEIGREDFATVLAGGNDRLFGDAGKDALFGQTGNDRLDGGNGNDVLAGGAGKDTFVFKDGSDLDRLLDLENGLDRIDLGDFGFASFAEVKALAADTAGGDLRLGFGDGDFLFVNDFSRADFTAGDVIL